MWKNVKYCLNASSAYQYSSIKNDFSKKLVSFLKTNPVNNSIRYQTTDVKSKTAHLSARPSAKRPLPDYLKNNKPGSDKQSQRITPGEWLLLTVPIATFALGTWQVKRRKWKIGLIENLEKRIAEPTIDFPDDLAELGDLEYRKVKVRGKFDHSFELYYGPRTLIEKGEAATRSGIFSVGQSKKTGGHCVITPFILSDSGKRILINRGWVPSSMILPGKRVEGQIEDELEITGVVRLQEIRGTFVPKNQPHINVFHYRDVKTMAKKCKTLPILLEATEDCTVPGGPIAGQTNVTIRNEHMSYIITWYSLSAITTLLWCKKFIFRTG